MTEQHLQRQVEALARALGWHVHHETDSRRSPAGLPDVVAYHHDQARVMFAELKTTRGRLRPEQRAWLAAVHHAGGEAYLWRPADLLDGTIRATLTTRPTPPPPPMW